ncbi:MAG: hypothetical protein RJQ14_17315 [Marinoscillum sp.]
MKGYKILLWIGLLIFIIGMIAEINAIDYLYHGLVVGPVFYTVGILWWIPKRLKKPILHPYDPDEYKSTSDAGLAFLMNNFLLEFWAGCCYLVMVMFLAGGLLMKQTEGYQVSEDILETDETVRSEFGKLRGMGHLISGSSSSQNAELLITIFGSEKNGSVKIDIVKQPDRWELEELKFY